MVTRLGRRAFECAVGAFALLGFVYVPLGKKTGFEHLKAVFTTPEAEQAARDLASAMGGLRDRVFEGTPASPEKSGGAGRPPKRSAPRPRPSSAPSPELPELARYASEAPDAGDDASAIWPDPTEL